jgi:Flp pilus assembly protein TadD
MNPTVIKSLAFALMAAAGLASRAPQPPTFNRHIAPIVFKHCAACHHPGGAGPFSLTAYADVQKRASQIVEVTRNRYMPPWLPDAGDHEFIGEQRLSEGELRLLERWVEAGAPEGEASERPVAPRFNAGWQLGLPDMILRMDEAFTVPAEGIDVFRNFVLPVPLRATRFVKAIEILPGNKRLVHHANVLVDRSGAARQLDARDPGAGFGGMEVAIEADRFDPDSHFLFWKPGSAPVVEADGMAWRCDPGTDLVLNMHLQPSGKPERIRAEIGLYFSDQPQTIFPMLLQLEHDGAIDIPPGKADFLVTDEFKLPVDVDLLGVYPHAHYLGKDLQGTARLPDGTTRQLIHIARWDLNWQGVYQYRRPVFLPRGTVLSMRYLYDNSAGNPRNPHSPPRRVRAGNRSSEEMGHLWLQVLPRTPNANGRDARVLLQEAAMRRRLEKYPADFAAHFNLGAALQMAGRDAEAIAHYQNALRVRPGHAAAHTNLAVSLHITGKTAEAIAQYRQAIRLDAAYAPARYNLANLLLARGAIAEATAHLREVLRLQPDDAGALNSLGSAFGMQGKPGEAAAQFNHSLRVNPDDPDVHLNLASVLQQLNRPAEAIAHLEQALRLHPANADAHNELGALLANQGRLAAAIPHFEQALRLDPNHAGARENLRRARAMLRR